MKRVVLGILLGFLIGIGVGLNEAREKTSQLGFIQAREETQARCADWSQAREVNETVRDDGTREILFSCNDYKFYIVSSWSVYHSDVSAYDINLIKEMIHDKEES